MTFAFLSLHSYDSYRGIREFHESPLTGESLDFQ